MNRVLITGANGLLGQALVTLFQGTHHILCSDIEDQPCSPQTMREYVKLDITALDECKKIFREFKPDLVINAAAYTNVDGCEKHKEDCWNVNVKGVENLARLCRFYGSHLIHYSTDYLFDGKNGPYGEDDDVHPLGYYGRTKLASENIIREYGISFTIIRTCVLYGVGIRVKKNFFLWVLENLQAGNKITVVTDQYNNPTLAEDLAYGTRLVAEKPAYGVFHIAGKEYLSRYDFAVSIAHTFKLPEELILPIKTAELKQEALRPLHGGLKIDRAREILDYNPRTLQESLTYLKRKLLNYEPADG